MPPDYEQIAGAVPIGGNEPERVVPLEELEKASQEFLPVTHPKYVGLAEEKGYIQNQARIKKTSYNHDAMIDVLLAEPTISQGELAARFGMKQAWISRIIGSDAFQAALAKRRDDTINPIIAASIEDKLSGVVNQSLEIIAEKLEASRNIDVAFKGLEIGVKALGFGARNSGATNNATFQIIMPGKAASSADWVAEHGMKRVENG